MKLNIATCNPDKLVEIQAVFRIPGLEMGSALDYPELPEVVEDGETLEANAVKKAVALAKATSAWALSDDTGLEVDALGGAPGVYAARYAGERATYLDNVRKLLDELDGVADRRARFRTAIALSDPLGRTEWVEGEVRGVITTVARGEGGFGYDPVFQPDGATSTFAELPAEEKYSISHRARALKRALEAWGPRLSALAANRGT